MSKRRKDQQPSDPISGGFIERLRSHLRPPVELPDPITFIEDPFYIGHPFRRPYPIQQALIKLIYLMVDHITPAEWKLVTPLIEGFYLETPRKGIVPDVLRRVELLQEAGYRRFREVIYIAGRRAGKGLLGAWIAAYELYWMMNLKNPQIHFHIDPSKNINLFVAATTLPQAKAHLFADIVHVVTEGHCFRDRIAHVSADTLALITPGDEERARVLAAEGIDRGWQNATLRVQAVSSNSRAARGAAVFSVMFDELAHLQAGTEGPQTAEQLVKSILPSLAQFGPDAFIYVPTSPHTKEGPAYEFYESALATDQVTGEPERAEKLLVQFPSWGPYAGYDDPEATGGRPFPSAPIEYDDFIKAEEARDPQGALVEYHGQFQDVQSPYLLPWTVDKIFSPICPHCAHAIDEDAEACNVCGNDIDQPRVLQPGFEGVQNKIYRCHLDPAESGSNFAMVIAHVEYKVHPDGQIWAHVFVDHIRVWRPEDYRNELPYDVIVKEIVDTVLRFPTLEVLSTDQFNYAALAGRLREEFRRRKQSTKVVKEAFTLPANRERAYWFKVATNINLIHCYRDNFGPRGTSLIERELRSLQDLGGEVKAPSSGPTRTKDAADALMEISRQLLDEQFKRGPRKRVGDLRLNAGAQGGFRSGAGDDDQRIPPRDTLRRQSEESSHRRIPGTGKPTTPRWNR